MWTCTIQKFVSVNNIACDNEKGDGNIETYNVIAHIIGHCSMIGAETGKVLNYAVQNKSCRECKKAENSNSTPVAHVCRRNFAGSAKSMESNIVVSMVKDLKESPDSCR